MKILLCIVIIAIILIILIKLVCFFSDKNKVFYDQSSGHYVVSKGKNKESKKSKVIVISTKDNSKGIPNVPMKNNPDPTSDKPTYFVKKVRNKKTKLLHRQYDKRLVRKDKKTADEIYKEHLKNVETLRNRRRE